ncbi:hypothetical protein PMZ80_000691 [Knufia obscura]|uniref:Yeast cell wall synthesis Kre9/Knh1-like N-terminal domain-containing protein n=2 Tax=Knufia TaxID=430999 RepID=A0AAN8I1B2_9EURO|nr:hypothetical protein PMZ80_000691 [Knufia obscura]KAK5948572.1 hypothetical protein OHC33_010468 [Knufia fluminis]
MHHFVTYAVLFLSTLYSLVTAKALLAVFHSTVVPGEVYEVEWLSDASDTLELLLVRQTDSGWSALQTLFEDVVSDAPGSSYNWTVNSTLEIGSGYGLWLSSTPVDPNDSTGYADLTDWFCVVPDEDSFCSSSSTSTSSTALATLTSTTSSALTTGATSTGPIQIANSTSVSGALVSQTAVTDDSLISINNDSGLSTGAIAGIVLGALAGIAIILLIILWFLRRKHKERKAIATANATATAELNGTTDDDRRPELGADEKDHRHELQGNSNVKHSVEMDGSTVIASENSAGKAGKPKVQQEPVEMP